MKLYIDKVIGSSCWLFDEASTTYNSVSDFLDAIPEDDNKIDLEIHSYGGDTAEGYAIYDAIRASGKEVSACVVGECCSMATVILLAAPKERRKAYKHASFLIHRPFYPRAEMTEVTQEMLTECLSGLQAEEKKMMDVYVERTGSTVEQLTEQMNDGGEFGVDKALELGFISAVVPEASAFAPKMRIGNKTNIMVKQKNLLKRLTDAIASVVNQAVAMSLTATDGTEIEVEREEGEIAIGDKASPDGVFILSDGKTVTIENGEITNIVEPQQEETGEGDEETEELKQEIDALKTEIEELKKSAMNDKQIVSLVDKMGGMKWLEQQTSSSYTPMTSQPSRGSEEAQSNVFEKLLKEARAKRNKTN